MALVMGSASQQQAQRPASALFAKRERRAGQEPEWRNARAETLSGHLVVLASGAGRAVFARLYSTSAGRMLVLWPDKVHASPIGCVTLRDVAVAPEDGSLTFTLRSQYDALPLVLRAASRDDFRRWTPELTGGGGGERRTRRKFTPDVARMPMLVEEEP